jgi:hypothetical protein
LRPPLLHALSACRRAAAVAPPHCHPPPSPPPPPPLPWPQCDLHQWIPLLDRFDEFLAAAVAPRRDLQLKYAADADADAKDAAAQGAPPPPPDPPFPAAAVLAVLRVTTAVLTHSTNAHLYASVEHLASLLAAPADGGVPLAALRALAALSRRSHLGAMPWPAPKELGARLEALAAPWEGGPGLEETAAGSGGVGADGGLHFEFRDDDAPSASAAAAGAAGAAAEGGLRLIDVPAAELPALWAPLDGGGEGGEAAAMARLVAAHGVPPSRRFELLVKVRRTAQSGARQNTRTSAKRGTRAERYCEHERQHACRWPFFLAVFGQFFLWLLFSRRNRALTRPPCLSAPTNQPTAAARSRLQLRAARALASPAGRQDLARCRLMALYASMRAFGGVYAEGVWGALSADPGLPLQLTALLRAPRAAGEAAATAGAAGAAQGGGGGGGGGATPVPVPQDIQTLALLALAALVRLFLLLLVVGGAAAAGGWVGGAWVVLPVGWRAGLRCSGGSDCALGRGWRVSLLSRRAPAPKHTPKPLQTHTKKTPKKSPS